MVPTTLYGIILCIVEELAIGASTTVLYLLSISHSEAGIVLYLGLQYDTVELVVQLSCGNTNCKKSVHRAWAIFSIRPLFLRLLAV